MAQQDFKDQIERIADKQDKMSEDIKEVNISLAKIESTLERNTDSLEQHMRRTEIAESRLDKIEDLLTFFKGASWVIGAVMTGVGTLLVILIKSLLLK